MLLKIYIGCECMYYMIVVDDEKIICDGLNKFISNKCKDFSVVNSFYNARTALAYVKDNPVDLILTDIKMPDMTGLEFAEEIRKFNTDVQIIFLSGFRNFDYAQKAIQRNVFSYLLKPIDNSELLSELNRVAKRIAQIKEAQTVKKQNEELIESSRERFFVEVLFGAPDNSLLQEKFEKLYINADFETVFCNIVSFDLDKEMSEIAWDYSTEDLKAAVKNYFYEENKKILYSLWLDQNQLLLIHNDSDLEFSFNGLSQWFEENFNMDISFINSFECTGIAALSKFSFHEDAVNSLSRTGTARISLLNTYIKLSLYNEAQVLFNSLLQEYSDRNKEDRLSQIKKIFDIIAPDQNIDMIELRQSPNPHATYLRFFERIIASNKSKQQKEFNIIKKIKEYVSQNYASNITLEEIGAQLFMNPVYLCRYFKQQTGENFSSYLLSIRMVNAIRLLKDGNYKIYEIANMVGYQNPRHFAKQFKLFTGYTPKQYRTDI